MLPMTPHGIDAPDEPRRVEPDAAFDDATDDYAHAEEQRRHAMVRYAGAGLPEEDQ